MPVPAYRISRNPPMGSKVISGGQTDRLVYLIRPLSFFESRLKIGFWNLRLKK
jgi:hypothetical protein